MTFGRNIFPENMYVQTKEFEPLVSGSFGSPGVSNRFFESSNSIEIRVRTKKYRRGLESERDFPRVHTCVRIRRTRFVLAVTVLLIFFFFIFS